MRKITPSFLFIIIVSAQSFVFGQSEGEDKKYIIREWGYTVLLDFCQNPVQRYIYNVGYGQDTGYYKDFGFGLGSFQYGFRYNLKTFSEESALCLSATPCITMGPWNGDFEGFGMFNVPLLLSYDGGAGSTYSSSKDMGGFIGAGIELYKTPIVFIYNSRLYGGEKKKSFWMEPVISAGLRRWKSSIFSSVENVHTIGVKFGMGFPRPYRKDNQFPMTESRSWSFRLYFSTLIGY